MDATVQLLRSEGIEALARRLHDPEGPEGLNLLDLLRNPAVRQAFLMHEPEPHTIQRVQAAIVQAIRDNRLNDPWFSSLIAQLRSAWPNAPWDPLRDAVFALHKLGTYFAKEYYHAILELHALFWDELSPEQLAWLYHFCHDADREVVAAHPRADRDFWRAVIRRPSPDPSRILALVAEHSSIARSDPELRRILLDSYSLDVYKAFVAHAKHVHEMDEIIERYAAKEAPYFVWRLIELVPPEQRKLLTGAVTRLLAHDSPDIRLKTQFLLAGAQIDDLYGRTIAKPETIGPASMPSLTI